MGLSRNKVAVSEGAAGSPPFYGECEISLTDISYLQIGKNKNQNRKTTRERAVQQRKLKSACCSIFRDLSKELKKKGIANTYSLFTITYYLTHGGVAQLGEHLPCKQGVMGSIPIISTKVHEGNR